MNYAKERRRCEMEIEIIRELREDFPMCWLPALGELDWRAELMEIDREQRGGK